MPRTSPGFPDVEDVDSVADVEARVERAARWVGPPDGRELLVDCRELLSGHALDREVDPECHCCLLSVAGRLG